MSLRARLTLLYTSLVGGILLIFGVVVYGSVSITLTDQIDENLRRTAFQVYENVRWTPEGVILQKPLPSLDLPGDVFVQVWSRENRLIAAYPDLGAGGQVIRPLDQDGLLSINLLYNDVTTGGIHRRVLTVPLKVGDRLVATLQVGTNLTVVDVTQRTLLTILVIGALLSITLAGLAGWYSTTHALAPLAGVTETALQITRADDLSRRIPYQGPPNDEVGQLIHAFNQTLTRLESLFNSQRRFIADVGHELRTPLTVIKGNVGLMKRIGEADPESLSGIESEVDRLTRLVGDLLLLAQAESGKLPMASRQIELDTLLLEAMQQMRVLAGGRLKLILGDIDQVLVCGDSDRIKQVLVNLIGNAIQYTPAGGEVVVGLGKVDDQARLTISDTGPGISQKDLAHIFERFYRGERSRTRSADGKGFGLGLSIAYWIVRNHGGRIDVDSKEGKGTTFCVWLPLQMDGCEPGLLE